MCMRLKRRIEEAMQEKYEPVFESQLEQCWVKYHRYGSGQVRFEKVYDGEGVRRAWAYTKAGHYTVVEDTDCRKIMSCPYGGWMVFQLIEVDAVVGPDSLPRLVAHFRPQVWVDDEAVAAAGAVEFDATEKLLSLSLKEIQLFKENDCDSDALAEDLLERIEHHGPFEVDVDVNGWLEKSGFDRATLTREQLEDLRRRNLA